jgi:hypothetical protein
LELFLNNIKRFQKVFDNKKHIVIEMAVKGHMKVVSVSLATVPWMADVMVKNAVWNSPQIPRTISFTESVIGTVLKNSIIEVDRI